MSPCFFGLSGVPFSSLGSKVPLSISAPTPPGGAVLSRRSVVSYGELVLSVFWSVFGGDVGSFCEVLGWGWGGG